MFSAGHEALIGSLLHVDGILQPHIPHLLNIVVIGRHVFDAGNVLDHVFIEKRFNVRHGVAFALHAIVGQQGPLIRIEKVEELGQNLRRFAGGKDGGGAVLHPVARAAGVGDLAGVGPFAQRRGQASEREVWIVRQCLCGTVHVVHGAEHTDVAADDFVVHNRGKAVFAIEVVFKQAFFIPLAHGNDIVLKVLGHRRPAHIVGAILGDDVGKVHHNLVIDIRTDTHGQLPLIAQNGVGPVAGGNHQRELGGKVGNRGPVDGHAGALFGNPIAGDVVDILITPLRLSVCGVAEYFKVFPVGGNGQLQLTLGDGHAVIAGLIANVPGRAAGCVMDGVTGVGSVGSRRFAAAAGQNAQQQNQCKQAGQGSFYVCVLLSEYARGFVSPCQSSA